MYPLIPIVCVCVCVQACVPVCEVPHVVGRIGNYIHPSCSSTLNVIFFSFCLSTPPFHYLHMGYRTSVHVNNMHIDSVSRWKLLFIVLTTSFLNQATDIIYLAEHIAFCLMTKQCITIKTIMGNHTVKFTVKYENRTFCSAVYFSAFNLGNNTEKCTHDIYSSN
jgi:hypothetical protein